MINYIKFSLLFIYELVINNPVKIIALVSAIVSINLTNFPDTKESTKIEKEIKVDSGYVYLHQEIINNQIDYKSEYFTTKQNIDKNGYMHSTSYSGFNVFFWILFVVSCLFLIIPLFMNDSDVEWELSEAMQFALGTLTTCELENNKYTFTCFGRLMGVHDRQISRTRICDHFNIYSIFDIFPLPKYKTKSQKRNSLIDDIV